MKKISDRRNTICSSSARLENESNDEDSAEENTDENVETSGNRGGKKMSTENEATVMHFHTY